MKVLLFRVYVLMYVCACVSDCMFMSVLYVYINT